MQEINSCPYCGENEKLALCKHNDKYAIFCQTYLAIGPSAKCRDLAVQKWNSRIQEVPDMPQEKPQIVDRYNARNFICPFRDTSKDEGCTSLCMMWIRVDDDKGRCGLVNTIYGTTGYGE